ncbi:MAG: 3-phosphoshikimate 1-carboxyvinyltransferase [Tuberibacillus sp.]
MILTLTKKTIKGTISVPGDKSISHRAAILGAMAKGVTNIKGFLLGEDCLHTLACLEALGVQLEKSESGVKVQGKGWEHFQEPKTVLDVGNSGTTMRLMMGLLSAQPFFSVLSGDASLNERPMKRVASPLTQMGAEIKGRQNGEKPPMSIKGKKLQSITYHTPVASAQVKSALLLAGLQSEGKTTVIEPSPSRDHTERMIKAFGGNISTDGLTHAVVGPQTLTGTEIVVPGDFSSAAFFIAAALITENSEITIQNVGINKTRTGLLTVLKEMGAAVSLLDSREENCEPIADIAVTSSSLKGVTIEGDLIPKLIDEIPIIALIASRAEGRTIIKDAAELKVKETNRIQTVVDELKKLGVSIKATEDGMIIDGQPGKVLSGGTVNAYGDHRIAMMLMVAALICEKPLDIIEAESAAVSFPGFRELLSSITYD